MIGQARLYHGQRYVAVAISPYQRRDGSKTALVTWQSNCPQCGQPFHCKTPILATKFQPNRRCQLHKRPGHRVKDQSQ